MRVTSPQRHARQLHLHVDVARAVCNGRSPPGRWPAPTRATRLTMTGRGARLPSAAPASPVLAGGAANLTTMGNRRWARFSLGRPRRSRPGWRCAKISNGRRVTPRSQSGGEAGAEWPLPGAPGRAAGNAAQAEDGAGLFDSGGGFCPGSSRERQDFSPEPILDPPLLRTPGRSLSARRACIFDHCFARALPRGVSWMASVLRTSRHCHHRQTDRCHLLYYRW